jgi:hypothetical protein
MRKKTYLGTGDGFNTLWPRFHTFVIVFSSLVFIVTAANNTI